MEQNTDLATLKALTDNGVNKVLQISSAIENVHSLLANGHPTVLAANSKSGSASGSKSGGASKARS